MADVSSSADLFREHLREIVHHPIFRASRRCAEFLPHIVEKALNGQFDDLKERSIGVELFGRPATYDTGADAIVRVTASDVRRRLHQYYAEVASDSELRIELPSGSYIPEFQHLGPVVGTVAHVGLLNPLPPEPLPADSPLAAPAIGKMERKKSWIAGIVAIAAALGLAAGSWLGHQTPAVAPAPTGRIVPWSALLKPDRDLRIVFCDPDISVSQSLLDYRITLSDYANQRFFPENSISSPEMLRLVKSLRGVNVASIDTGIALGISRLDQTGTDRIRTHTARSLHVLDFKTEDNFVILGSPRSNPWFELYRDELDFRFEYDVSSGQEVIRNHHPRPGEEALYVPTAKGWGTGHAYGVVAFVANTNQKGHVLMLAGSNAEATEAAGRFVMNLDLLERTLRANGIDPKGPPRNFEALLRVGTIAGSPDKIEILSFHRLSDR